MYPYSGYFSPPFFRYPTGRKGRSPVSALHYVLLRATISQISLKMNKPIWRNVSQRETKPYSPVWQNSDMMASRQRLRLGFKETSESSLDNRLI